MAPDAFAPVGEWASAASSRTTIKKIGRAYGIVFDKALRALTGLKAGDRVSVTLHKGGVMVLTPLGPGARASRPDRRRASRGELTCTDLAGDLIGSMRGPADFSTNKRYLEEAILADYFKRAKKPRS